MEAHAMNSITQNHQDEELLSKKMQVVSHTLLSTENAKKRLREVSPKIDARSNGGKQRKLAQQTVVAKTTKMCIKGVFSLT